MRKNEYENLDRIYSIAIMSPFIILTIQYFLLANLMKIGIDIGSTIQLFSKVLVGLVLFHSIIVLIIKNKITFIITYLLITSIFLVQYTFIIENRPYMQELIFPLFFMCLPLFTISLEIKNFNVFKNIMFKSSIIIYLFGVLLAIQDFTGIVDIGVYSGPLSNYLLIPTIVFIDKFFDKMKFTYLLFSIVSGFFILVLGSRGALLCILFYLVVKFMLFDTGKWALNYLIKLTMPIFFIIIVSSYKLILVNLQSILLSYRIESRSIELFLNDNLYLSGRDYIYSQLTDYIIANPIIGFGIGGDRRILDGIAVYAHNIGLEVLGDFGILFGSVIIIIFTFSIIHILLKKKNIKRKIIIVWLSIGFIHLFISSSYLIEMKFWILLGLMINILFINKSSKQEIENYDGVS